MTTLPKFNMEPKNDGFQKESPGSRVPFSGSMWIFGRAECFLARRDQVRTCKHPVVVVDHVVAFDGARRNKLCCHTLYHRMMMMMMMVLSCSDEGDNDGYDCDADSNDCLDAAVLLRYHGCDCESVQRSWRLWTMTLEVWWWGLSWGSWIWWWWYSWWLWSWPWW